MEHKPGRELDALVAENVMQLKPFKKRWESGAHIGFIEGWLNKDGFEIGTSLPKYSTDIAAAWEVVEKLKDNGHHINIAFYQKYPADKHGPANEKEFWRVSGMYSYKLKYAESSTAPHAICLAALKAIGYLKDSI